MPDFSLLELEREKRKRRNSNYFHFVLGSSMKRKGPYGVSASTAQADSIGKRVAKIRKAWGLTQAELAARLRVKTASVSAWEREKATPNGISLIALASVLNTTPEALLGTVDFETPAIPDGVTEPSWKTIHLPLPSDPAQALLIKEGSVLRAVPAKELKALAAEAIQDGRPVWLVIGQVKAP